MASKFIAKYPVPEDFPDLLHDFAREVLRDQPENIYEYGAQYFKALYMVSDKPFMQVKTSFISKERTNRNLRFTREICMLSVMKFRSNVI